MSKPKKVSVMFTKAELWELMGNFDASFSDSKENELAVKVSEKLHEAYEIFGAVRVVP